MLSIRKCPKYWLESEPTISLNYKWAQFLTISEDSFASLELFSKDLPKVTKLELDPVLEEDWDVLVSLDERLKLTFWNFFLERSSHKEACEARKKFNYS